MLRIHSQMFVSFIQIWAMEIHIGKEIKKRLDQLNMKSADLAKLINTSRQNMRTIYSRKSMDTEQLLIISKALDYNFFALFSDKLSNQASNHLVSDVENPYTMSKNKVEEFENALQEILKRLEKLETTNKKIAKPAKK